MRKIVVTSGKGGVGKTTVCASLGRALADMGQRVVLVDGDVGLNNLDVVMGIENKVVFDILDVIEGKCRINQALVRDDESTAFVLPTQCEHKNLTPQNFRGVINSLTSFDYVLIDCPAGIESGFHRAVSCADEAIVVTTPNVSAIRDADKVISLLNGYQLSNVNVVINRIRGAMVAKGDMISATDIARLLVTPAIGIIPEDDCITLYSQVGRTPDYALSHKAFLTLAENVHFKSMKYFDYTKKSRMIKFWGRK